MCVSRERIGEGL